jgi:DNA-binding transcriptional LysR family regulator
VLPKTKRIDISIALQAQTHIACCNTARIRFIDNNRAIASAIEDFDATTEIKSSSQRPFRIATYDNIACGFLSGLRPTLISMFPYLSISVGGPNSRILGDLVGGKFNCALIAQPRILPGLEYRKVFTERYGIFMSRKSYLRNSLHRKSALRLDDLKEFKLIAMPDAIAGANKSVDRLLWEFGLESVISIDSYEVAIRLVLDGHGIGIMPYSSASRAVRNQSLTELSLKEIPSAIGPHDLTLCWNTIDVHPKISDFEKIIVDEYSEI